MAHFDTSLPARHAVDTAHSAALDVISRPGSVLTGAERVAAIRESRQSHECPLCAERKKGLSPHAAKGAHEPAGPLASRVSSHNECFY